ncbi:MAG: hypothetical protein AB1505_12625 [Candidatus Latescibacterota bacterium]
MERRTRAIVLGVLALCALVPRHASAQPAEPLPPIVQPAGEEAYHALMQFLDYDRGQPLDARVVATEEIAGQAREKIAFNGPGSERVPGYLAFPKDQARPCPLVLELHGLTESKEVWWQEQEHFRGGLVTQGLLRSGIAVLALDAPNHGERTHSNDYRLPWGILADGKFQRWRRMLVDGVVEYRVAMDYLATRVDVDTCVPSWT